MLWKAFNSPDIIPNYDNGIGASLYAYITSALRYVATHTCKMPSCTWQQFATVPVQTSLVMCMLQQATASRMHSSSLAVLHHRPKAINQSAMYKLHGIVASDIALAYRLHAT